MRKHNQLSPLKIAQLKAPGKYHDGHGLYLYVSPARIKSWTFRYMIDGRARELGLGPLHSVNLSEARNRARDARQILLDGRDPLDVKRDARVARIAAQAKTITFRQAVDQFLSTSSKIAGLKNDRHRKQWRSTLETVFPTLGHLPLNQIGAALVLQAIKPIWERTPETASRLRRRIERVFAWAMPIGYFTGDNPAQWDLLKDHLPAKPEGKHHKAMPYAEVPAFMVELAKRGAMSARVLEFAVLTAVRTKEVLGTKWAEIDLKAKVWAVPAARMKKNKDFRVPLNNRAVAILETLPRTSALVFPNAEGNCLNDDVMRQYLQSMVGNGYTPHGFRSSFSDWARDKTNHPRDVVELALAHTIKDKTEAAYRRGDALEKRRELMADWEKYLEGLDYNGRDI
jgi:integrase